MHDSDVVAAVLAFREQGLGGRRIARRTGLPLSTVRDWLAGKLPAHSQPDSGTACLTCGHPEHDFAQLPAAYTYLLGLYLGDGCISSHPRGVFRLRVFLDLRYPKIVDECAAAMALVVPRSKVHRQLKCSGYLQSQEPSSVEVSAFSRTWTCLLPQHGPGRKHTRKVELTDWQQQLVRRDAGLLLRGLIHSDGCRFINTGTNWVCPRYSFSNKSTDIRVIFCEACDLLGLRYTFAKETIYVSRKADVALLDTFVGPKC